MTTAKAMKKTRTHQKDQHNPVILRINKKKKQPFPTTTAKDLNPSTADELTQLIRIVAKLFNKDTVEFVNGMLLEDPDDNGTKEFVCEILVEALLSQLDFGGVDGAALCDRLFALLDFNKQQQQQQLQLQLQLQHRYKHRHIYKKKNLSNHIKTYVKFRHQRMIFNKMPFILKFDSNEPHIGDTKKYKSEKATNTEVSYHQKKKGIVEAKSNIINTVPWKVQLDFFDWITNMTRHLRYKD